MTTLLKSTVPAGVRNLTVVSYIQRAWPLLGKNRIDSKQIKVNGSKVPPECMLRPGDEVCLYVDGKLSFDLESVFEDERLIAIVKPAGLPVDIDESGIGEDTVLTRLRRTHSQAQLVHRLDTGTSGIMLAALNDEAREKLEAMFRDHCFEKTYRADVSGKMPAATQTLEGWLVKDPAASKVRVVRSKTAGAKDIKTIYRVKSELQAAGKTVSRLEINIPTGRTHQIRAHMASIGHPLLGDDKYGDRDLNKALKIKGIRLRCVCLEVKNAKYMPEYAGMKFTCGEDEKWTFHI